MFITKVFNDNSIILHESGYPNRMAKSLNSKKKT